VHGHNNIIGATLFPHNVALGAAHDPALVRRIGAATAEEIAATGIDWALPPRWRW
jgi:beta-glucosidase